MNNSANKLFAAALVFAAGFCGAAMAADSVRQTGSSSKSVGLTNLDDGDTPPAPAPAAAVAPAAPAAPVAAAATPAAAKAALAGASAPKAAQAKVIRPNDKPGTRSARSAWPDTSKLPPASEPHKLKTARVAKPVLDPIAKTAPKSDGSGVPEPLAQHRLDMTQTGDHDKYINSNTAASRRYLRVDRATYARENKAP